MKKHIFFLLVLSTILVLVATSCSTGANEASATIVLSSPRTVARSDETTETAIDSGVLYYFHAKIQGEGYISEQSGSFNDSTSQSITFDNLSPNTDLAVTVDLYLLSTATSISAISYIESIYEGNNSFTVEEGDNQVTVVMKDAFTYVGGASDSPDGTYDKPYGTLEAAIAAKEDNGKEPATFNFYKLKTDLTVSTNTAISPTYNTYINCNGHLIADMNYKSSLFTPNATLVIVNGSISGTSLALSTATTSTTLARIITTAINSGLTSEYSGYSEPMIVTSNTLVMDEMYVTNFYYTGTEAALISAAPAGNSKPSLYLYNSSFIYCISKDTTNSNKGIIAMESGTGSALGTALDVCYGTKSSGFYFKDSTFDFLGCQIDATLSSTLSNEATFTTTGPLTISGGTVTLCGSWCAVYEANYNYAVSATDNAVLQLADSSKVSLFNQETLTVEQLELMSTSTYSPNTAIISGTYTETTDSTTNKPTTQWTGSSSSNALVLGAVPQSDSISVTTTGTLKISGKSSILGLTYLNTGSYITQTGTISSDTAAVIDFAVSETIDNTFPTVKVFTETPENTSKFSLSSSLEKLKYELSETNAVVQTN